MSLVRTKEPQGRGLSSMLSKCIVAAAPYLSRYSLQVVVEHVSSLTIDCFWIWQSSLLGPLWPLCVCRFLLGAVIFMSQWTKPAPYGQHEKSGNSCGPMVHQRITHTISDAIPGVLVFTLVFFLYGHQREYLKITFYCLWQCHYIHRGFINPWITK